jgi:hypothetical protein
MHLYDGRATSSGALCLRAALAAAFALRLLRGRLRRGFADQVCPRLRFELVAGRMLEWVRLLHAHRVGLSELP